MWLLYVEVRQEYNETSCKWLTFTQINEAALNKLISAEEGG